MPIVEAGFTFYDPPFSASHAQVDCWRLGLP